MKFSTFITAPEKINSENFGDSLTSRLMTPASPIFHVFSELSQCLLDGLAKHLVDSQR